MKLALMMLLAALAAAAPAAPAPRHGAIDYVDLTDDFARVYDRDTALPQTERVQRFKSQFATLIPGFYSAARTTGGDEAKYDERLVRAFARYPDQRAGIARVSRDFAALIDKARLTFEARFGPFPADQPVYLVNSLGEMDGGRRDLAGKSALVFGADVIAKIHGNDDLTPFFHHELFHVYHSRQVDFDACDQLWCALWGEGLAVYVAQRLNPKASDSELLLTVPEPIRPAIEAHEAEAICATVARLDSRAEGDFGAMFSSGRLAPDLPPRFGYYVGYLVARDIGRTHSLRQLATMQGAPLRAEIGKALAHMASCPPGNRVERG